MLAAVGLTYLVGRSEPYALESGDGARGRDGRLMFSSGTSFIKLVADTTDQLPAITYWLMGSLTHQGA